MIMTYTTRCVLLDQNTKDEDMDWYVKSLTALLIGKHQEAKNFRVVHNEVLNGPKVLLYERYASTEEWQNKYPDAKNFNPGR